MRCVIFKGNASKLRFQMQEGLNLIVRGSVSAYIPRGEYQINCLEVLPDGIGELSLTYQQLKTSLQARGYFDNKKPIPAFPKRVAVLTSITGAVIEDIKKSHKSGGILRSFLCLIPSCKARKQRKLSLQILHILIAFLARLKALMSLSLAEVEAVWRFMGV